MQYDIGVISEISGTTVTGIGTGFIDNVKAGDLFNLSGVAVFYQVASVTDNTHLELSVAPDPIVGSYDYKITRDFTPYYQFAEVQPGTTNWMSLMTMNLRQIDLLIKGLTDRVHNLDGL